MGPCLCSTGDDTHVECCVWLNIAAKVGLNVLVHSHDKFATCQSVIFLVIYGRVCHGHYSTYNYGRVHHRDTTVHATMAECITGTL
jgi:hypothetical protein